MATMTGSAPQKGTTSRLARSRRNARVPRRSSTRCAKKPESAKNTCMRKLLTTLLNTKNSAWLAGSAMG
jgi:hypothetical protein